MFWESGSLGSKTLGWKAAPVQEASAGSRGVEGSLVPAKLSWKEQSGTRWSRVEQFKVHATWNWTSGAQWSGKIQASQHRLSSFWGFVHHDFHYLRLGNRSAYCRKCPPPLLHLEKPCGSGHWNSHHPDFVLVATQNWAEVMNNS